MPLDDRVIAISATFTAEAILPGLAFWARELGLLIMRSGLPDTTSSFRSCSIQGDSLRANRGGFQRRASVRFEDWLREGSQSGLEETCATPGRSGSVESRGVCRAADRGDLSLHSRA